MIATVLDEMKDAETKAWKALAGYKFWMFGYHAAAWIKYKNLLEKQPDYKYKFRSPFKTLVDVARKQLRFEQQWGANARLIATAPMMLEALKEVLWRLGGGDLKGQHLLYSDSLHPKDDDKLFVEYIEEVIKEAENV